MASVELGAILNLLWVFLPPQRLVVSPQGLHKADDAEGS